MSVLARALAIRRLIEPAGGNAALRLLRSSNLPLAGALLPTHLGAPGARIPTAELHERLDIDLEELRPHLELPERTGKAYCDDWRAAGLLVRRAASDARGETYELSPDAIDALRVLEQLEAPRTALTESRLVSLAAAVRQLAIDTDPDVTRRIDGLRAERARLDAEIARLESGDIEPVDERRARERATEVLVMAQDLPTDFARVRAQFEALNHDLRARILDSSKTPGSVLDDVFRGVDLIESSDEGRTFTAFAALVRDAERSDELESDLSAVLSRDFALALAPEARRILRALVRQLKSGSREVQVVLTEFARGLRRYVQSHEFQRDRALRDAIQEALAAAVPASRRVKPYTAAGIELELTASSLRSAGELTPHDPAEFEPSAPLEDGEPGLVDFDSLAAIARETEIDFVELTEAVNRVVARGEPASVGEVLEAHPASQGLASVIGLLSLATRHGAIDGGVAERLTWTGADGAARSADVERHVFTKEIPA